MAAGGAWRLLGVAVLSASFVRGTVDVSNYCQDVTEDGYYCATCLDVVYCQAGVTTAYLTCLPDNHQVCDGNRDFSICVPADAASHCQCESYSQCDSYNPIYVARCNDGGMYDVVACENPLYTCDEGKCGSVVPGIDSCDDQGAIIGGWNFITPDCTTGFYCYSDGRELPVQCDALEYIDEHGNCLPAPPEPCASGCTGPCPDNLDCTRYYYCDDTGTPVIVTQCPAGQYFDPNAEPVPMCQDDDSLCAPLTFCDFSESLRVKMATEAPTPPPCTPKILGNACYGPCSSHFWACDVNEDGDYEAQLLECPNDLTFNCEPVFPYCDLSENVPSCNIKTGAA